MDATAEGYIQIDTTHASLPEVEESLYANRSCLVQMQQQLATAEVSIIIPAYNRLEKTRRCVSSVLTYTKGIDYELILIDNGSNDGTLSYFQQIPYEKKKIVHITKNLGAGFPLFALSLLDLGHYVCIFANDLIVTANWLNNLLLCIQSDPRIGMVNPVSSNTSNFQNVNEVPQGHSAMQAWAKRFNQSDPTKWEDRQRLITLGTLYRKEALMSIGWPAGDVGFFHDFADDDITFRMRRAGYRAVLAGDTWICHDHDRTAETAPEVFQRSLEIGQRNFRDKYFGVDAWEDVNNYYLPFLSYFPEPKQQQCPWLLGVDVKCGTPILDLKNWLRKFNIFSAQLSAFTQDPKYWMDLKTICDGPVLCDREEFLTDGFLPHSFDYVVADRPINRYHEPQKMLNDLFSLCKAGGILVCRLANSYTFQEYMNLLGRRDIYNPEFAYAIPVEVFQAELQRSGAVRAVLSIPIGLDTEQQQALDEIIPRDLPPAQRQDALQRLQIQDFLFVVERKE